MTIERDRVSVVFRGCGKTSILKAVIIHAMLYGWREFVLLAAWTVTQATEHVHAIREELETNRLIIEDFGVQKGRIWRNDDFTTINGRTVKAVGVQTGVRGALRGSKRPDLLAIDDVEADSRVQTIEQRDKLYNRITTAFLNLGGAVSNELWVWITGTPLHLDCLLNRLKNDGWNYYQAAATIDATPEGIPTWPEFDQEKIQARIKKIGSKAARQELFLAPLDEGEAAFELDWFRFYSDDLHIQQHWDTYLYIDPAIGLKNSSDTFVACVVAASPYNYNRAEIRVLTFYVSKLSVGRQIAKIYDMCNDYNVIQCGIEANAYQDALRQQILEFSQKEGRIVPAVPVFSSRAKALRIRDSSPVVEFGEVSFHESQRDIIKHMCDWPSVSHDDIEDAFAGAVKMVRRTGRLMT